VGELPAGALVDVLEAGKDFLRVLTSQDTFVYLARLTPMEEERPLANSQQ